MGAQKIPPSNALWVMYKGVYDFDKLYQTVISWFNAYLYEFHEKGFKNKDDNIGTEFELKLFGKKKVDAIAQYQINIHLHNSDTNIIYVEQKDGSKKRMYKGRIRIDIQGEVTLDYQKNFNTKKTSKWWDFLSTKVIDQVIDFDYYDDMWYKVHALQTVVKDVLNMDTAGNNF